jgi:hypothetical protein
LFPSSLRRWAFEVALLFAHELPHELVARVLLPLAVDRLTPARVVPTPKQQQAVRARIRQAGRMLLNAALLQR